MMRHWLHKRPISKGKCSGLDIDLGSGPAVVSLPTGKNEFSGRPHKAPQSPEVEPQAGLVLQLSISTTLFLTFLLSPLLNLMSQEVRDIH